MNSLLNILLYVCFFPILLCIIITISTIFNKIKSLLFKKEFKHEDSTIDLLNYYKDHPIVITVIFLLSIFYTLFSNSYFTQAINHYDLESSKVGEYCYYVKLETETEKSYTLPAKIIIDTETYEDADGDTETYKRYYIEHIYWSNGGYLTFEEDNRLYINKPALLTDTHNRKYQCTLLNEHAYTDKFEETTAPLSSAISMFSLLFCIIFTWIYALKSNFKKSINDY